MVSSISTAFGGMCPVDESAVWLLMIRSGGSVASCSWESRLAAARQFTRSVVLVEEGRSERGLAGRYGTIP